MSFWHRRKSTFDDSKGLSGGRKKSMLVMETTKINRQTTNPQKLKGLIGSQNADSAIKKCTAIVLEIQFFKFKVLLLIIC